MQLVEPTLRHAMNIFGNGLRFWRTFEAFAIAMVFCALTGMSIPRVSLLPRRTMHRAEMSEQPNASQRATPAVKVLALAEQPAETLNSRRSAEADVVAEDIIVHYEKPAISLHGPAMKKPTGGPVKAQLLPLENTTLKPGVRFTFGKDADMLAADTLIRYGAESSGSRVQDEKKAALNSQAYK
jgi:hypothetical protein